MTFADEIKIPKERVAVLIGKKGETKHKIEKKFNVHLNIDSNVDAVIIEGDDGFKVYNAKNVVHAIGRGFNPKIALKLLNDDYFFDLVELTNYGHTNNAKVRLRSRVIGSDGRARANLERLTNTDIEIYGKTVGIIGLSENVVIAKKAIEMLLEGAKHSTVYRFLEKANKRKNFERVANSFY